MRGRNPTHKCGTVPSLRHANDSRAKTLGDFLRSIAAAVVGNYDLADRTSLVQAISCAQDALAERLGFVEAGNHDRQLDLGIYGGTSISERHRHRYEVDIGYRDRLETCGLRFSGVSPDGRLPEIVEIPDHPWFIGVQFHPELKSKPFAPHPLFADFIRAALEQSRLV
jgi:CTP synthase (UTP-ammonia lyase)